MSRKSKERFAVESLKAADLSLWMAKEVTHEPPAPEFLVIADNSSVLDRFNAEKNWIELYLTRMVPMARPRQITQLLPFMSGIHSTWAYKQLEAAVEGIVDFKLEETTNPAQNLIRIRNLRNVGFDGKWHQLNIAENFEFTIEK